jgi:hypothetical protein
MRLSPSSIISPGDAAERLTDAALRALTRTAALNASEAARALRETPPRVADRLPDAALRALAHAAAQGAGAAEALAGMPPQIAERLPEDDRIAWAQHAPPEAPAHGDALAARPARAQRDAAAAPLRAIQEERGGETWSMERKRRCDTTRFTRPTPPRD